MGTDVLSAKAIRDAVAALRKSSVSPGVVVSKRMAAELNRADRAYGLKCRWKKGDTYYWGAFVWE